jgi:hypothetical protein
MSMCRVQRRGIVDAVDCHHLSPDDLLACLQLFLFAVSYVPAGLRLGAIMAMAPGCMPPQLVPANAGKLVVADLRQPGSGSLFSATPREAWIDKTIAELRSETDSTRDLVVFVHGFRTNVVDATCAGKVLRTELAELPAYSASDGPDIFVFGWPGELSLLQFAAGRDNAARAGLYLSGILQGLTRRRVFLVAHSLGAEVVMGATADMAKHDGTPSLAGMLLIEGAIPALSIRHWRETFTETHPYNELLGLHESRPPYVENTVGSGRFVDAAAKVAHLVVTTAGGDVPLGDAFALDETFRPSDRNRPMVLPEIGDGAGGIDVQAIGTPFPTGKIFRHAEDLLTDLQKEFETGSWRSKPNIPIGLRTDPSRVVNSYHWVYEFQVQHPPTTKSASTEDIGGDCSMTGTA